MKLYYSPQLNIIKFNGIDIICTSREDDGFVSTQNANDNDFEWGWVQ